MEEIMKKILECDDIKVVKNCIMIMADNEKIGMNDKAMLDNLLQLRGEIDSCNFDEETAKLHLCIIGFPHAVDIAKDYWSKVKNCRINVWDWCVLWGEMDRMNGSKIRKWFPTLRGTDYEKKVFDECISFLENGNLPYYDLKV